MSTGLRLAFLLLAVVIAVGAFFLIGGGEDEPASEATATATPTPDGEVGAATPESTPTPTPTPTPRPRPPLLTAGSDRTIRVEQGDRVRFRVRHPTPEEVHVHGYDIARELQPGRTTTVSFPADIAGIFEVELELSHQPLGTIEVRP